MSPPPHKICPQCQQPAVLAMPQCRRCGYFYPPPPPMAYNPAGAMPSVAPLSALSPQSQRELQQAALRAQPRRSRLAPVLMALMLLLIVCGGGALLWRLGRHAARAIPLSGLASGVTDNAGTPHKGGPDLGSGLFVESESKAEAPELAIHNDSDVGLKMVLKGADGKVYELSAAPDQTAHLQVPAGDYALEMSSDSPYVLPNSGDATFRRHKKYDADFVLSNEAHGPIHIGD